MTPLKILLIKCLVAFSLPVVIILLAALALPQAQPPARVIHLAPLSQMPQFVHNTFHDAQIAYRFAAANPELLHDIPCYCGCVYMNHENNLDCYVKEFKTENSIVFDEHAAGCGICVEITLDVMRLWGEGQDSQSIYDFIVETYSARGPSTEHASM
jgi:hypothetical protein